MSILYKSVVISPEEYLEGEKFSDVKHEYTEGDIYAMVGASRSHNLVAGNLYTVLRAHLRGGSCQVFISDMKVRIANAFYYPDVVVACDAADRHEYYNERPLLIIEVLSASTASRDTLEKRIAYQSLTSLQEYVLVAQDRHEVSIYRRSDDGWDLEICSARDVVKLAAVGLEIGLESIYEGVSI